MIRLIAALGFMTLLSGCFQAEMKIEILSPEEGQAITTVEMSRENYNSFGTRGPFCEDGELTVGDESVVCVTVNSGTIDELTLASAENDQPVPVTRLDNGNLRVAFPIGELAKNAPSGPQALMMAQMLGDSMVTIKIVGKMIVETNMTLADDGKSARFTVETLRILQRDDSLPAELFAIVNPN